MLTVIWMALQSLLIWITNWLAALGASGLLILGIALLVYSAVPLMPWRLLAAPAGILSVVAGVWLGFNATWAAGQRDGTTVERARWEAAAEAERQRQAAARAATEALGRQVVDALNTRMAGIEQKQTEILDAARAEDAKPVPDDCRNVYRGLPPGVLQGLDAIR